MKEFVGKVTRSRFASGSKSERGAIRIRVDETSYVLRRQGGNPLADPALDELVGRTIRCRGEVSGYTLTMASWVVVP